MVRALNVKELFPAMRRSIPVARRDNKGHRCHASLDIRLPRQRAEIHKYARSYCCGDVNGMEAWKSSMSKRRTRRSGLADWRDSNAPTT